MASAIPTYKALTLDGIFQTGETYTVPLYQRGYAWTDEEVDQLMKDLISSFTEKPQEHYLLGQAIVCKTGSDWEIVDGQQRLTTLFLLIATAWRSLLGNTSDFDFNTKTRFDTLAPMILNVDGNDIAKPRLEVAKSGRIFVDKFVRGEELPDETLDGTQENIRTAIEVITESIDTHFQDADKRFDFIWFVIKYVVILRLELESTNQALRVFQKMNNRGLTLDDADLLKNLLFVQADDHEFSKLSKSWDDATQALYKSKLKRVRSMEFLMKALIGIETGKSIPTTQVFEEWEGRLEDKEEAKIFASSLETRATSLQLATHNFSPKRVAITETPGTTLFKWVQHLEALLAGDHLEHSSYLHLCEVVENRAMLSMLAGEKNQDFERILHKWSNKISKLPASATRSEIIAASSDALGPVPNLILDMRREVPRLSYSVQTQRSKLRYCLARIAQAVEEEAKNFTQNNELLISLIKPTPRGAKKYHLDHVFPKSDAQRIRWDDPDKASLIHSIGNLILLHPDDNQSQGDDLPSTRAKTTNLVNSRLLINQVLCDSPSGLQVQERVKVVLDKYRELMPPTLRIPAEGQENDELGGHWGSTEVVAREAVYLDILETEFRKALM